MNSASLQTLPPSADSFRNELSSRMKRPTVPDQPDQQHAERARLLRAHSFSSTTLRRPSPLAPTCLCIHVGGRQRTALTYTREADDRAKSQGMTVDPGNDPRVSFQILMAWRTGCETQRRPVTNTF